MILFVNYKYFDCSYFNSSFHVVLLIIHLLINIFLKLSFNKTPFLSVNSLALRVLSHKSEMEWMGDGGVESSALLPVLFWWVY